MARPTTDGNSYFPLDVDFLSDPKIRPLFLRFGSRGVVAYLWLLCEIYRNSYCLPVDDDFYLIMADTLRAKENFCREVVDFMAQRSLFNDKLLRTDKVLTSRGIQLRFQEMIKGRAAKRPVEARLKYWVLKKSETAAFIKFCPEDGYSGNNGGFSENNPNKSGKNPTKKSKVKIKEKENKKECTYRARRKARRTYGPTSYRRESVEERTERLRREYGRYCGYGVPCAAVTGEHISLVRGALGKITAADYVRAFEAAGRSKFLSTNDKKRWRVTFGWILKPEHVAKLLAGEYDDWTETVPADGGSFDTDEFFELALKRSMERAAELGKQKG